MNGPCQGTSSEKGKNVTTAGIELDGEHGVLPTNDGEKLQLAKSRPLDENSDIKLAQTAPHALPALIGESDNEDFSCRSCFPRTCCRGDPIFGGNKEALAWAVDNCASIVSYVGTGAFLGTVR